jgi:hypothetical protein
MTYFHLEKSVANGLEDTHKIQEHQALEFIRKDSRFNEFVINHYSFKSQNAPTTETMQEVQTETKEEHLDLYASLLKLGDLKEKGIINEEEFNQQKKKILDTL